MAKKSISFLLPAPGNTPQGGYKVVYEYANRFAADGWDVGIMYAANIKFKGYSLKRKLRAIARYLKFILKGWSGRSWFPIDKRVKEKLVFTLDYTHALRSDVYVATAVQTAIILKDYPVDNRRKIYLIQGYEDWAIEEAILHETYRYGFRNMVVSGWLQKKLASIGVKSIKIPNGFDFNYFQMNIPVREKNPMKISMLYHPSEHKGASYGLEALAMVKERFPELKAVLFGFAPRPETLPEWMEYYQRPDRDTHNRIYNECAINLAPSLTEGWGLTVGEAMICGAAIVCTDTLGFQEMVNDGESALISPVCDSRSLADNIIRLIESPELRYQLAECGHRSIQRFNWEESYNVLRREALAALE